MTRKISLKWALPLFLAFITLLGIGISIIDTLHQQKIGLTEKAKIELLTNAARLARMAEEDLRSDHGLLAIELANISSDPNITAALVIDNKGRVLSAHRYAWNGRLVSEVFPLLDDAWRTRSATGRLPQFRLAQDNSSMEVLRPFELSATTNEIRSNRKGVIYIAYDLSTPLQKARQNTLHKSIPFVSATLLILILLIVTLHYWVSLPLIRLSQLTSSLRTGKLNERAMVSGAAEIATLANDFNSMAFAIQTTQEALAANEEWLRITLFSIGDALITTNNEGHITLMNQVAQDITKWTLNEAHGLPINDVFVIENALTGEPAEIPVERVLREGQVVGLANHTILIAKDGTRYHISDSAAPIRNAKNEVLGVVMVFQDVTEQYALRKAIVESEQHFRNIVNSGQALIWITDPDKNATWFNEAWLSFTDTTLEQQVGSGWHNVIHPEDLPACVINMTESHDKRTAFSVECRLKHAQGDYRWIVIKGSPCFDSEGDYQGFVGHCLDNTEAKQAAEAINHLAFHDSLTGLPNRMLLLDRLSQALASARRSHRYGALLFIDLDKFKNINDVYGHPMGDAVLQEVATRLKYFLRHGDTVARLGGDEFIVLLPELTTDSKISATAALTIAEKIRVALENKIQLNGHEFNAAASIGITLFPKQSESVDDIVTEADIAMYRAKDSGRNGIAFYESGMHEKVTERYALEKDLRVAIQNEQLEVYLQSQWNAHGEVLGAEALLRWRHPSKGMISPMDFIPIAEESGLIIPLGEWVLLQSCHIIKQIESCSKDMTISVNVSPRQFAHPNFVQRVTEIVAETKINTRMLILEITENSLVNNANEARAHMLSLNKLGIRFSIDDFGTGYSSLSYLKHLPLFELKIDKSFIQDVPNDANDVGIVDTIIAMAHHMKLEVVAEGVETKAQLEFLKERFCERYQGYYFHRPQPINDWLKLTCQIEV